MGEREERERRERGEREEREKERERREREGGERGREIGGREGEREKERERERGERERERERRERGGGRERERKREREVELCGRTSRKGSTPRSRNQGWWTEEVAKAVWEKREARKMIEGIRDRGEQPPTGLKYLYGE